MLTGKRRNIKFEWDIFKLVKKEISSLLYQILYKRYFVSNRDIENHWPELYELILRNEYVNHIKDENVIFDCWIHCKKPPNSNSLLKFYSNDKCYLS